MPPLEGGSDRQRAGADSGERFEPCADASRILHALLDLHEKRSLDRRARGRADAAAQALRVRLSLLDLPGYFDQRDPLPRRQTNEQLGRCQRAGWLALEWKRLAEGELLERVELLPAGRQPVYALLGRRPEARRRADLAEILLGQRFRFEPGDWRRRAIDDTLRQIEDGRSPAPFDPRQPELAEDLLTVMAALDGLEGETPYRVFSVRLFGDSKRFDPLAGPLATLARRARAEWRGWPTAELLRELGLVANPSLLLLRGDWCLEDGEGRRLELAGFEPAVGVTAQQILRLSRVRARAARVICVENLTSFHALADLADPEMALLCLAGNPGPATRKLLRLLDGERPPGQTILAWNDIDYGGLNILAQLRQRVSPEIGAWRMDRATLDAHARWARPLTAGDRRGLMRLAGRPELDDRHALIEHMLERGLKLEQEAVEPGEADDMGRAEVDAGSVDLRGGSA